MMFSFSDSYPAHHLDIDMDDDAISLGDASDLESLPDDSPSSEQGGGAKKGYDSDSDDEIDIDLT